MQKMCSAKHQLVHMGGMMCLCSVCCPRSYGLEVGKKKKKQGHLHIWGLGIENMASFSQFKNYVEEGRKSCKGFEFLLMCPDGDYEIQ